MRSIASPRPTAASRSRSSPASRWRGRPIAPTLERRFVDPLLDRLFPTYPELLYVQALRERRLPDNIEVREFFLQAGAWLSKPGRAAELHQPQLLARRRPPDARRDQRVRAAGRARSERRCGARQPQLQHRRDPRHGALRHRAAQGRQARGVRRRGQRQPAVHAGRGRGRARPVRRAAGGGPAATTCSRRPRSRCRSPTTPWRCTRRR